MLVPSPIYFQMCFIKQHNLPHKLLILVYNFLVPLKKLINLIQIVSINLCLLTFPFQLLRLQCILLFHMDTVQQSSMANMLMVSIDWKLQIFRGGSFLPQGICLLMMCSLLYPEEGAIASKNLNCFLPNIQHWPSISGKPLVS